MSPQIQEQLNELSAQVAATVSAEASAVALIDGFGAKLDAAVAEALANGASAAELTPLTDLSTVLKEKSAELAAAVAANS